jgi:hypothetical protein
MMASDTFNRPQRAGDGKDFARQAVDRIRN